MLYKRNIQFVAK